MARCPHCPVGDGPCIAEQMPSVCERVGGGDPRALTFVHERAGLKLPGAVAKALSLARSVARHAANGLRRLPEAARRARLEVCRNCPVDAYRPDDQTCVLCGCYLPEKAAWASEPCPSGFWPGEVHGADRGDSDSGCGCGR